MDEFTQAVFEAAYASRAQRNLRLLFGFLLVSKHTLRGLIFSWPLYLLSAASFALPGNFGWVFALLLIPGAAVSGYILNKGLREDYAAFVKGRLLKSADLRRAFWGSR